MNCLLKCGPLDLYFGVCWSLSTYFFRFALYGVRMCLACVLTAPGCLVPGSSAKADSLADAALSSCQGFSNHILFGSQKSKPTQLNPVLRQRLPGLKNTCIHRCYMCCLVIILTSGFCKPSNMFSTCSGSIANPWNLVQRGLQQHIAVGCRHQLLVRKMACRNLLINFRKAWWEVQCARRAIKTI